MFVRRKWSFLCFSLGLFMACGEKEGPVLDVQLLNAAAFADPNASDLVLLVTNVPVAGAGLDVSPADGNPDTIIAPSSCDAALTAGCGLTPSASATAVIGELPLGFRFFVEARLRDAAGNVLYQGMSAEFDNDGSVGRVQINLAAPGS